MNNPDRQDGLVERLRVWRRSEFGQSAPGLMFEEAADHIESLQAQLNEYREALTPSGDTKAEYHGEFYFIIPQAQEDENGEPIEVSHRVYVPWTTVKEIMAAISARATRKALDQSPTTRE